MIVYVGEELPSQKLSRNICFITDSGEGHADEILAVAIFEIAICRNTDIMVIRTRDPKIIAKADAGLGVEWNELDLEYGKAGCIWETYAEYAIRNVATEEKYVVSTNQIKKIKEEIYKEVILPVDKDDKQGHMFDFVKDYFMPTYLGIEQDYNKSFWEAEKESYKTMYDEIKKRINRPVE